MFSTLLLPLLAFGAPDIEAATPPADAPIRVSLNERAFRPGDRGEVEVRTDYDGYLIVLHADPEGHLRVLFPLDPGDDNRVRGGKRYELVGRGERDEAFYVGRTSGDGLVYAAVSRDPFRFDQFVRGDHWDYEALAPARLSSAPEPELTDLVQRMATGSFDYDVATYSVVERVVYADSYTAPPVVFAPRFFDPWCDPWFSSFGCSPFFGSGLSVGIFFGHPHRFFFHDPFLFRRRFFFHNRFFFHHNFFAFHNRFFFHPFHRHRFFFRDRFVAFPHHGRFGFGGPDVPFRRRTFGTFPDPRGPGLDFRDRRSVAGGTFTGRRSGFDAEGVRTMEARRLRGEGREVADASPRRAETEPIRLTPTPRRGIEPRGDLEPRRDAERGRWIEPRRARPQDEGASTRLSDLRSAPRGRDWPREVRPQRVERAPRPEARRALPEARSWPREVRSGAEPRGLRQGPTPRRSFEAPSRGSHGSGYARPSVRTESWGARPSRGSSTRGSSMGRGWRGARGGWRGR
jgi:hypothetical protein